MMPHKKVLIVDDDKEICSLLSQFLTKFQFIVKDIQDGVLLQKLLKEELFDIVLLDIMLPSINGFELCKQIRESSDIPIIIISALEQDTDRILGLEMGADDYLPKPFNTRELLARINALLRRTEGSFKHRTQLAGNIISFASWHLDRHAHLLFNENEVAITLSSKEFRLLELFLQYPNQILSRDQIMDQIYDKSCDPFDRTIDVLIGRVRKKIEVNPNKPLLLQTIRGEGYMLKEG
ncbi:response regulator transcription factor [Francisellaceae bacterium]|nr:response regulator transcription factor [Francisellaceae bacterium]